MRHLLATLAVPSSPERELPEKWTSPSRSVVLFGEIFGPGIQDMDYGRTEYDFRVFDISVDGVYVDYSQMVDLCDRFGLLCVPQLAVCSYHPDKIEELTYGETTFDGVKSKFKGREGCVIRPVQERFSSLLGGRLILKSVSADYRDRKGAQDIGE